MVHSTMIDPFGRTSEERAELREKIKRVNEEAAANWSNPAWRAEMAADMTETIYTGFEHENLLSLMSNVDNVGFNDRAHVKEVKGLRTFWVARGGYIEESTMRAEIMEIPRDTIGFHVSEMEDKLMVNFAETQSTLIELGIQRLDADVNARFLALLQTAIPSSSDYYLDNAGLDLTILNTALREVRDTSRAFDITIVGRSTMTDQIIDELLGSNNGTGFIPETNEALVQRGVLGNYRGARIVTLTNWKDDQENAFFPANELYVIGRDASKCAFFGGLMSKEFVESDNWYWHYLTRRDFGAVVHRPDRIRRIIDTSTTP